MRRYETIVISHPSLSQEERQPFFDKLTNLISEGQGLLVNVAEWGQKRLAYEIKKETRGYYVMLDYCGNGALVKELERNIRLDDRSLKYMTVCLSDNVDLEKVRIEMEAAQRQETEASRPSQEPAADEQAQPSPGMTETNDDMLEPDYDEEATDGSSETDE